MMGTLVFLVQGGGGWGDLPPTRFFPEGGTPLAPGPEGGGSPYPPFPTIISRARLTTLFQ